MQSVIMHHRHPGWLLAIILLCPWMASSTKPFVQQQQKQSTKKLSLIIYPHSISCHTSTLIQILIIFTLCCGNWRTHCGPAGWGGEALAWHSCVIQFSLDLVSLFSLIYIVVSSTCYTTPTTTIFSIYFLMQPSGGGKQNEEGVLWFHQWTMQAGIKKEDE